ncbi:MAG: ATP-binding protein [Thermoplasmatales archaeon]|nr:ATP-binding protein [Thermoplasmatales archaeon]
MERKIMKKLLKWKNDPDKVGLLVEGARQVGKTHIIREFGKNNYDHFLELNFQTEPEYCDFFKGGISAAKLHTQLTLSFEGFRIEKGRSLLFLDEIQECPNAIMAIKPLVVEGSLDVIGSGSLLGIRHNPPKSYPVGYVQTEYLHSMDFEEYLWAIGISRKDIDFIRKKIKDREPFGENALAGLNKHYRRYLLVGGMPKPVKRSTRDNDMGAVVALQKNIIEGYKNDIVAYAATGIKSNTERAFELIPSELARTNKRFRFSEIEERKNVGIREYAELIDWLNGSHFVNLCYDLSHIERPLEHNKRTNRFKMYMADTGLLVAMMKNDTRMALINGDVAINEGAIAENSVCEMLSKCGFETYYLSDKSGRIDLDFVAERNGKISVIEVKSGRNRAAPSFRKIMNDPRGANVDRWIMFQNSDIYVDETGVEHYPLFCAAFADSMFEPASLVFEKGPTELFTE